MELIHPGRGWARRPALGTKELEMERRELSRLANEDADLRLVPHREDGFQLDMGVVRSVDPEPDC